MFNSRLTAASCSISSSLCSSAKSELGWRGSLCGPMGEEEESSGVRREVRRLEVREEVEGRRTCCELEMEEKDRFEVGRLAEVEEGVAGREELFVAVGGEGREEGLWGPREEVEVSGVAEGGVGLLGVTCGSAMIQKLVRVETRGEGVFVELWRSNAARQRRECLGFVRVRGSKCVLQCSQSLQSCHSRLRLPG